MSKPAHPTPRVRPRRGKSMAAKADRHELYELSVQAPETDAATLAKLYKKLRKRHAMSLREDFCGTALLCGDTTGGSASALLNPADSSSSSFARSRQAFALATNPVANRTRPL